MHDYEVKYKRNRSLFQNGSAPQLTIMGNNKQYPEVSAPDQVENVTGILGQNRLSQNDSIRQLIRDRQARAHKHESGDQKTFFTAEERAKIFGGMKAGLQAKIPDKEPPPKALVGIQQVVSDNLAAIAEQNEEAEQITQV